MATHIKSTVRIISFSLSTYVTGSQLFHLMHRDPYHHRQHAPIAATSATLTLHNRARALTGAASAERNRVHTQSSLITVHHPFPFRLPLRLPLKASYFSLFVHLKIHIETYYSHVL